VHCPQRCPTINDLPSPQQSKSGWPWTEESAELPDTMPDGSPWPRLSIVTPSYSQGRFIEETIRSILLQGYPNLEYIIIDGGSTDNTVEIIRKYEPWLAYWVSEPDRGQSDAINKGLARASGEIAAWLNCDDIYLPRASLTVAKCLAEHPHAALLYGGALFVNDTGNRVQLGRVREFDPNRPCETTISQPAAFFRRLAFWEVGGLDIDLHYRMDLDLWIKMARSCHMFSIPCALAMIRVSLDTKTASMSEQHWEELARIGERYQLEGISRQYVLRQRALKQYQHGAMLLDAGHAREARLHLAQAFELGPDRRVRQKAALLWAVSYLGTRAFATMLKWKIGMNNRRSTLERV
jgi:glycosyltransferase involved in cell wall biosynthesis